MKMSDNELGEKIFEAVEKHLSSMIDSVEESYEPLDRKLIEDIKRQCKSKNVDYSQYDLKLKEDARIVLEKCIESAARTLNIK